MFQSVDLSSFPSDLNLQLTNLLSHQEAFFPLLNLFLEIRLSCLRGKLYLAFKSDNFLLQLEIL